MGGNCSHQIQWPNIYYEYETKSVSKFDCTLYCNLRGLDVTPITLALSGAAAYPRGCQALASMLSRGQPNPADMTVVSVPSLCRHVDGLECSSVFLIHILFMPLFDNLNILQHFSTFFYNRQYLCLLFNFIQFAFNCRNYGERCKKKIECGLCDVIDNT